MSNALRNLGIALHYAACAAITSPDRDKAIKKARRAIKRAERLMLAYAADPHADRAALYRAIDAAERAADRAAAHGYNAADRAAIAGSAALRLRGYPIMMAEELHHAARSYMHECRIHAAEKAERAARPKWR